MQPMCSINRMLLHVLYAFIFLIFMFYVCCAKNHEVLWFQVCQNPPKESGQKKR